jgi:sRNA-binding regulator protein Hfq
MINEIQILIENYENEIRMSKNQVRLYLVSHFDCTNYNDNTVVLIISDSVFVIV